VAKELEGIGNYPHGEFSCSRRETGEVEEIYESAEVVEGQRRRRRLDKFLKFYVAFELLAAALRYRKRCNKEWAKQFCKDYGVMYQIGGGTCLKSAIL
jgi:hypothetical protein